MTENGNPKDNAIAEHINLNIKEGFLNVSGLRVSVK